MKATNAKPATIEEYIEAEPADLQKKLRQMHDCIRSAAPSATEALKWSMPAYSYHRILVTFALHRHHIGFYPTPSAVSAFKQELAKYKTATGSVQFPLDQPLPLPLIRKMTKFRVRESQDGDRKWKE